MPDQDRLRSAGGRLAALFLLAGSAWAQVPADRFAGLTLDGPLPERVRAWQPLAVAGSTDSDADTQLLFAFQAAGGGEGSADFFLLARADGRFERDLVLTLEGTYALQVFAGPRGELLSHRGTVLQFEVTGSAPGADYPAGYFDGLRLDEPLARRLVAGRPLLFAGRLLDPAIRHLRVDLVDPVTQARRQVAIGHDQGRFAAPLRLAGDPPGPLRLEVVASFADDTWWLRGSAEVVAADDPIPELDVGVLAVSLRAGTEAVVPLANRGGADLALAPVEVEGNFAVVAAPDRLAAGARGQIRVVYGGSGGDRGLLVLRSDDPARPVIEVALVGQASAPAAGPAPWERLRADADGALRATLDLDVADGVLALYSARLDDLAPGTTFGFVAAGPLRLARPAAAHTLPLSARDRGEAELRRREQELARRLAAAAHRPAARRAAVAYATGDRRTLVFEEVGGVPRQEVSAAVVATSARAVAFLDARAAAGGPSVDRIQQLLDRFDADWDLMRSTFGVASDVDGDGRVAFLFTPLVDATQFGGFFDAASVVPAGSGGNGNTADLIFVSVDEPPGSYRSLLVHELQHLISFNQHALVRFGAAEVGWLNEGLSHLAEDLVEGHYEGGNAERARAFLDDPSAVGLEGDAETDRAKRGAAYLFARSLADRFGQGVLLRLVQTGLNGRDNLEQATGQSFEELLATFGVQLYVSGTEVAAHPRFDYTFAPLSPGGRRSLPPPRVLDLDADGSGLSGVIRPAGLAYLRVGGQGRRTLAVRADPGSQLRAVLIPVARDYVPSVYVPTDYFRGLLLEGPLPVVVRSGQGVRVAGAFGDWLPAGAAAAGAAVSELVLEYQDNPGATPRFGLAVDGQGRFDGDVVFAHQEAGDYALSVFARWQESGLDRFEWLGRFAPARVLAGSGIVHLPVGFFRGVRLDQPLPTRVRPAEALALSGRVLDDSTDTAVFQVAPAFGDTVAQWLEVGPDRRFRGTLDFQAAAIGSYDLNLWLLAGPSQRWAGGTRYFAVALDPVTAVAEGSASRPVDFALQPPFPNPFNSAVSLVLDVPRERFVEVAIFDLAGQRVAAVWRGPLPAGRRQLLWEGRDGAGRPAASGVYLVRASAPGWVGTGKVLLLR